MPIIIKGRHIEVPEDLKSYIEDKISNIVENLEEPNVCDVILMDSNGNRGGIDKEVHITCTLPHIKNPVFVSEKSDDFYKTIDLVGDKLKRALHNAKR